MAKQVRPWLAKPEIPEAHKVRPTDRGVNQRIPSGTAAQAAFKVRMYGCNLYLQTVMNLNPAVTLPL
jgi:hypothetical protein